MPDRSVQRLDAALRRMNAVSPLPPRDQGESFRGYFVRIAPEWIEAHGAAAPALAVQLEGLVQREYRRHPRLAPTVPAMRPAPTSETAQTGG